MTTYTLAAFLAMAAMVHYCNCYMVAPAHAGNGANQGEHFKPEKRNGNTSTEYKEDENHGQESNIVKRASKKEKACNTTNQHTPKTIAFHVYQRQSGTKMAANKIIRFNHITTNEGNAYDMATGTFSCLKSGLYMFHWSFVGYYKKSITICFSVDGKCTGALTWTYSGSKSHESFSNSVIVRLKQGQQVWLENKSSDGYMYCYYNSNWPIASSNTFSGYFISE